LKAQVTKSIVKATENAGRNFSYPARFENL